MKRYKKILGLSLMAAALLLSLFISYPTLFNGKSVSFVSSYKNKELTLKGTYYAVKDSEYAVIVAPGYSCDRAKWRPVADMLCDSGYSTLLFDYSGQGESEGVIGFDNAKTDNIPMQIDDAIEFVHTNYGYDYEKIILVGHSMGGRAILRLLYDYNSEKALTSITYKNIKNVILLSPEVNYNYNAQASFFAGTSDATDELWKDFNRESVGETKVYLFGSYHDDIVSPDDVLEIARRLNETAKIESGVLHSYMMYSPKFIQHISEALTEISGHQSNYKSYITGLNYCVWIMALIGLNLFITGLKTKNSSTQLILMDKGKYIRSKLLMWIPGLVVALIVCTICVMLPFGSPVMNIPYMNFIAAYGIVMTVAYKHNWIKGVEGKKDELSMKINLKSILVSFAVFIYVIIILKANMYNLVPFNWRMFWWIFCSMFMSFGYFISSMEQDMLGGKKMNIIYNLIQYIPLFLLVGFYLFLKSYSGMIGQIQNMVFMYMVCVPLGNYVNSESGNRLLGAVISSLLFQMFMITSAALIAIF